MKIKHKLPVVFSEEEIKKMIDVVHNIKYKAIFMTMYSTGIRLSELTNLRPTDIDSKRMVILKRPFIHAAHFTVLILNL
ncbi:MAG: tyrosine-type recombinase/integrase, partial [Pseudomonadota bacterium]